MQLPRVVKWRWVAAVTFGTAALLAVVGLSKASGRKSAPIAPAAKRANPSVSRSLGHFVPVPGNSFLMAGIQSEGGRNFSSFGSYSSGKASSLHNYVFLDVADGSFRRLIPTNDYYIPATESLPEAEVTAPGTGPDRSGDRAAVRWWLFEVVKQDTDRDGDLDEDDLRTLAVSDAGGRGYTELIEGIRELYGRALRDPDTLLVVYESGGTKRQSVIDLPRRVVTSTSALPGLGPDVK